MCELCRIAGLSESDAQKHDDAIKEHQEKYKIRGERMSVLVADIEKLIKNDSDEIVLNALANVICQRILDGDIYIFDALKSIQTTLQLKVVHELQSLRYKVNKLEGKEEKQEVPRGILSGLDTRNMKVI